MTDIYLDSASLDDIRTGRQNPLVRGFTTNPTLMKQAGVTDYEAFCREALQIADGLPISFEVFSDEWEDMERQACKIASWGSNVNVKIPVTNTKGESAAPLVEKLSDSGIICNVTAVFTIEQIRRLYELNTNSDIIISVFMGRMNDVGYQRNNINLNVKNWNKKTKFLWASTREVLNIYHAEFNSWDIITVTPDLLAKYEKLKGKDLTEYSLDTVKLFTMMHRKQDIFYDNFVNFWWVRLHRLSPLRPPPLPRP